MKCINLSIHASADYTNVVSDSGSNSKDVRALKARRAVKALRSPIKPLGLLRRLGPSKALRAYGS